MGGTLFFDPALLFVLVGVFTFFIGFAGCVGSLRENTCLLLFVCKDTFKEKNFFCLCFIVQFRFSGNFFRTTCLWYIGIYLSRKGLRYLNILFFKFNEFVLIRLRMKVKNN
jgi:hypothetical protein